MQRPVRSTDGHSHHPHGSNATTRWALPTQPAQARATGPTIERFPLILGRGEAEESRVRDRPDVVGALTLAPRQQCHDTLGYHPASKLPSLGGGGVKKNRRKRAWMSVLRDDLQWNQRNVSCGQCVVASACGGNGVAPRLNDDEVGQQPSQHTPFDWGGGEDRLEDEARTGVLASTAVSPCAAPVAEEGR